MKANPGLPEISHSITGGATEAQGIYPLFPPSHSTLNTKKKNKNRILGPLRRRQSPSRDILL